MEREGNSVAVEVLALDARLGHVIKRAEQALIHTKNRRLRQFGLTVPQYAALLVLSDAPSALTAAQLARKCLVTPQTMATVLGNLETKSLIAREHSSLHARVVVVELTRQGRALLKKADAEAVDVERRLAEAFEPAEREELRDLLERAIAALQDTREADERRSAALTATS
jgi:DNA-binding MarR family transcriptional regulator